jgi:hypothetical protein
MYWKDFFEDIVKQYKNDSDIVKEEDIQKITSKLYGRMFEKGNPWLNNSFQHLLHYFRIYKQQPMTIKDLKEFMKGIIE